jgi:hypothetical protein
MLDKVRAKCDLQIDTCLVTGVPKFRVCNVKDHSMQNTSIANSLYLSHLCRLTGYFIINIRECYFCLNYSTSFLMHDNSLFPEIECFSISHSCIMTIFVSFRMESKEKCEQIIQMFNGSPLAGSKEPLLVKFADGGIKKRNIYKSQDQRMWKDGGEVSCITCICLDCETVYLLK